MTPGIPPSNVKIRLRKKLPMRPVMSTASGGKTTQKKYRSAFIFALLSLASASGVGRWASDVARLLAIYRRWVFSSDSYPPPSAARNLRSLDSTADRGKDDATAIQNLRFVPRYRSPYIS